MKKVEQILEKNGTPQMLCPAHELFNGAFVEVIGKLGQVSTRLGEIAHELKALSQSQNDTRKDLLPAATNRDYIHKDIARPLFIALVVIDMLMVIWFTGLQPYVSTNGIGIKHYQKDVENVRP